ncbi:formylglycine-generating enzyme family protein [Alteribacter salitolerans]|uniref:formylglycine-generating enzyme family protein n=1 Tax=Alteribacter salitolerans TaxID=2912333 RepID=UPI003AF91E2A
MNRKSCCAASREGRANSVSAETIIKHKTGMRHTEHLIRLDGGEFIMGTDEDGRYPGDGEGPSRPVRLKPFAIDRYAVTNAQFQEFVEETSYVTEAEHYGWSFVFHMLVSEKDKRCVTDSVAQTPWWFVVNGAKWNCPEGPDSSISDRMDHPVIHVSWNDAIAYCNWSGKRLPTEAEWEYAAKGGLADSIYPWGNELLIEGEHQCNIWQGNFPSVNTAEDGFVSTAPVSAFFPNGYGLYNTVGNVWEWCGDWFTNKHKRKPAHDNPKGPVRGYSKVMKGGSYLCHDSYCNRYRVAARTSNTPDSSTGNIGFRCAVDLS